MERFEAAAVAAGIDDRLRGLGSPERAAQEKRYLKSALTHVGVRVPDVRRTAAAVRREHPNLSGTDLFALVEELWRGGVHERRLAAVELLQMYGPALEPADLSRVERLLRECRTWALVDPLAITVAGGLVTRYPQLAEVLDDWVGDGDFWIRRAALLALLPAVREGRQTGQGDLRRFERYADAMLEEREFFIRKAIGWVLREISRDRPDHVRDWVAARTDRVSGVTIREAVRHLPTPDRERLLAAYRERRQHRERGAAGTPGRG